MIDRIFLGYVVDFIDFRIIDFAIFNFADACVTVGTVLLFVYIMFFSDNDKNKSIATKERSGGNENTDGE